MIGGTDSFCFFAGKNVSYNDQTASYLVALGCSVGQLVGRSVGQSVSRSVSRSVGQSVMRFFQIANFEWKWHRNDRITIVVKI